MASSSETASSSHGGAVSHNGSAFVVRETRMPGILPLYTNPAWQARFPWLFQATTGRGSGEEPFDLSFFGKSVAASVLSRWSAIREATRFGRVVHARQVHGDRILEHQQAARGIHVLDDADGHITQTTDLMLAVSIADCVPVFLVHGGSRTIALLHAGWRGAAAGILERGIEALGGGDSEMHCHFGPAICGKCYEVGPEVFKALGQPEPARNQPIDLRAILRDRAIAAGVPSGHVTISGWCTRCDDAFFSHRGGMRERQMALLGIRPPRD